MKDETKEQLNEQVKIITDPVLKEKCKRMIDNITRYKMNQWGKKRMRKMMGEDVL